MKKKILSILLATVMLLTYIPLGALTVSAAGNSLADATAIDVGQLYSGSITSSNKNDVYKVTLSASGKLTLNVTSYIEAACYYIYDAAGAYMWGNRYNSDANTQTLSLNHSMHLTKGTYYFVVNRIDFYGGKSCYGDYQFKISFTSAGETFAEPQGGNNNALPQADPIGFGTTYKGQIAENDDKDLYKFTLAQSSTLCMAIKTYLPSVCIYIYDAGGNQLWGGRHNWDDNTQSLYLNEKVHLTKGTYYLAFVQCVANDYGNYNFKLSFSSAGESFVEPQSGNNNTLASADTVKLNASYKGQLATNDNMDFYKFTVSAKTAFILKVTAAVMDFTCLIYDVNGDEVWGDWFCAEENADLLRLTENVELSAGTYYLAFLREDSTGNYSFSLTCSHQYKTTKITKATLSAAGKAYKTCSVCGKTTTSAIAKPTSFKLSTYTYSHNGETKTPGVVVKDSAGKTLKKGTDYTVTYASGRKNVGTYKVTVTMKGKYSGTKTMTFKIIPPKTTVAKLTPTKTTMKVYVSRKSSAAATGYQIQYATNKDFTNAKTKWITKNTTGSVTLTGLKSKTTQFVRVRTYKKVGDKTYYSGWSSKAYMKTK